MYVIYVNKFCKRITSKKYKKCTEFHKYTAGDKERDVDLI